MASGEPTLDPSLTIAFGTSEALNLALASIRAAMVVINGNPGPAIDYFALLQAAADIIEYRRDIMDEVETALQCPQNPVDLQDGYQAANAWYVDLKARISDHESQLELIPKSATNQYAPLFVCDKQASSPSLQKHKVLFQGKRHAALPFFFQISRTVRSIVVHSLIYRQLLPMILTLTSLACTHGSRAQRCPGRYVCI